MEGRSGIHSVTQRKSILMEENLISEGELQGRVTEAEEGEGVSSDREGRERDAEGHRRQHSEPTQSDAVQRREARRQKQRKSEALPSVRKFSGGAENFVSGAF